MSSQLESFTRYASALLPYRERRDVLDASSIARWNG